VHLSSTHAQSDCQARVLLQVLEQRPDLASLTGMIDRSSAMHRAAAGGHLGVLRAIVESLRAYGASVLDPSKSDHKVTVATTTPVANRVP
jgi:hypothetical protein